jgi:hypothetical protein
MEQLTVWLAAKHSKQMRCETRLAGKHSKQMRCETRLAGNGRGFGLITPSVNTKWIKIPNPTPASSSVPAPMKRVPAPKSAISHPARYFSPRDRQNEWDIAEQPPEFWNQFKTDFAPGTHVRVHPLLDWTELNIWEYIDRENIPTVSLYYDQGEGKRYRSLGCYPCTNPIDSTAKNTKDIIEELRSGKLSNIAERSGRAQDAEDGGGLETLRRDGYM